MLPNHVARRTSPRLASAAAAVVERLETRRMLYETGGHWENEDDLAFSYVNVFDGGIQDIFGNALPDATIRSAILEAMSVWAGVVPVKIHQEPDNGPNPPTPIAYFNFDRLLRFGHRNIDGPGNVIGEAWGPDDLSSLAGDVNMDNSDAWGTTASGSTADILELLVHEVGHALGMHHEDDLQCIMNSTQQGVYSGLGSAFLFQDDINGIQSLYGAGLGYVLTDVDRLFVSGTNSDDTITVDYDSATDELVVNSVGIGSFRIDEDEVLEIVIDARGGNDTIRISSLDGDTTAVVNAGAGNDTINVGGSDLNTNVNSDVTVNGGSGSDTLYIRDGDDDGGTYDINPANISKPNSNVVYYPAGDVESLIVVGTEFTDTFNVLGSAIGLIPFSMELQGNGGADTFNVNFVDSPIDVVVLGGASSDTINVGNGVFDVNIEGTVDVDGGDSGDVLTIDDKDDVGGGTYELDAGTFSKDTGSGIVTFSNVSQFRVDGSGGPSTFDIDGVAAGTSTTVDGRGGDDTFTVGDYDYDTNILGTLSISGGGGTDFLEILDSSDGGADDYFLGKSPTFGTFFQKLNGELTIYSGIEQMHVQANNSNNTITVADTELGTRVTVYGLGGNDDIIIGTGDLDLIDDELVIWAGAGTDTVTFDDSLDEPIAIGEFPDGYRINDDSVVKFKLLPPFEQQFDYFEVENVVVEGNSDGNTFNVQSTGAAVTLNGNDGNDRYNIGMDNNVAGIDGEVVADGGAGTDTLHYNDSAATQNRIYTVSPNNLSRTNVAITRPYVDEIVVNAGTGNDTLNVTNNVATTVNGGEGNDTFNAGNGLWDFGVIGTLAIDGGSGTDSLLIDDTSDTGADNYALNATVATKNTAFAGPISYTTIESLELGANSEANIITVNNTFDGDVTVRGRGGADQIIVAETFPGRAVTVEDGPDLDQVQINANGVGTAAVQFATSQDLALLTIGNGGSATLLADGGRVINTQTLNMASGAILDLTDNAMIVDYTGASPINGIIAILIGAYNGGAWNGPGITSSVAAAGTNTALGYAEASSLFSVFPATFEGQSVDNTSVLIKHTFYGDTDLNGNVNLADFNRLAANFGQSPRRWVHGNSNFDGGVNLADFNLMAANFGSAELASASDPEPMVQDKDSRDDLEDLVNLLH